MCQGNNNISSSLPPSVSSNEVLGRLSNRKNNLVTSVESLLDIFLTSLNRGTVKDEPVDLNMPQSCSIGHWWDTPQSFDPFHVNYLLRTHTPKLRNKHQKTTIQRAILHVLKVVDILCVPSKLSDLIFMLS